jgi:hypothetical protein
MRGERKDEGGVPEWHEGNPRKEKVIGWSGATSVEPIVLMKFVFAFDASRCCAN